MSNPLYRGPNGHPHTLGEFVGLVWSIRWSCARCNLTDMRKADMVTALKRHGPDYPTSHFMREMHCRPTTYPSRASSNPSLDTRLQYSHPWLAVSICGEYSPWSAHARGPATDAC